MSLKIKEVVSGSPAEEIGFLPEDELLFINGAQINNFLDLQFYSADPSVFLEWKSAHGEMKQKQIELQAALGLVPHQHRCRECQNDCVFCFIRQLPKGMRSTLYLRDDDFLFSFIYGNFITFSNITSQDLKQIKEQNLSPLYVSVHSLDLEIRKKMIAGRGILDIEPILQELFKAGIRFHFQIVLVPGYNDGQELTSTLQRLQRFEPESIGIVPVGLTKHRQGLPPLRKLTPQEAKKAIDTASKFERVYCADELYLRGDLPLPDFAYYQDFPQLENGIGLVRQMISGWEENRQKFYRLVKSLDTEVIFVCGESIGKIIEKISLQIKIDTKILTEVVKVKNHFFGTSVTVSGLLTAEDILNQINGSRKVVCLSSSIFNTQGVTLDGESKEELKEKLNCFKLLIVEELFREWELI